MSSSFHHVDHADIRAALECIPELILLRDGHEVARLDGLIRDRELEEALDAHRPPASPRSPQ